MASRRRPSRLSTGQGVSVFQLRPTNGTITPSVRSVGRRWDMSQEPKNWRCKLGQHHYVEVPDDNPEMRGKTHQECARCRHIKDINEYQAGNPGLGGA
jgi:hypothetical protein